LGVGIIKVAASDDWRQLPDVLASAAIFESSNYDLTTDPAGDYFHVNADDGVLEFPLSAAGVNNLSSLFHRGSFVAIFWRS